MNNKLSVKGLANIGQIIGRANIPKAPEPAPKRDRRDVNEIARRTREKIVAAVNVGAPNGAAANLIENYVQAGMREAYNAGHADALDQNSAVEVLLEKQYDARTKLTMPTVAAAIMEQLGLSSMTLDLAHMMTVFKRIEITYTVSEQDVIEYTTRPIGDDDDDGDDAAKVYK